MSHWRLAMSHCQLAIANCRLPTQLPLPNPDCDCDCQQETSYHQSPIGNWQLAIGNRQCAHSLAINPASKAPRRGIALAMMCSWAA
jgi:hypothetical protein